VLVSGAGGTSYTPTNVQVSVVNPDGSTTPALVNGGPWYDDPNSFYVIHYSLKLNPLVLPSTPYTNNNTATAYNGLSATATAQLNSNTNARPVAVKKAGVIMTAPDDLQAAAAMGLSPGEEYIQWTVDYSISYLLYNKPVWLGDYATVNTSLNGGAYSNYVLVSGAGGTSYTPTNVQVSVVNPDGSTTPYTGAIKSFSSSTPGAGTWYVAFNSTSTLANYQTNSLSPFTQDTTLRVTYKTPLDTTYLYNVSPATTLATALNYTSANGTQRGLATNVANGYYVSGTTTNVQYIANVTYPIIKAAAVQSDKRLVNYTVTLNPGQDTSFASTGTQPVFTDTFDSRMQYVPDTFYVTIGSTVFGAYPSGAAGVTKADPLSGMPAPYFTVNADGTTTLSIDLTKLHNMGTTKPNGSAYTGYVSPDGVNQEDWLNQTYPIVVHYQLRLDKNLTGDYTVKNTATAYGLDASTTADVHGVKEITKGMADSGNTVDIQTVDIQIDMNPDARQYDGGIDPNTGIGYPLTVTDTMSDTLLLYPPTIQIFTEDPAHSGQYTSHGAHLATTNPGDMWSYTLVGTNQIKFIVPDCASIRIVYQCQVQGAVGSVVPISNEVEVAGYYAESHDGGFVVNDTNAGGSGSRNKLTIHKMDAANNSINLQGARFALYAATSTGSQLPGWSATNVPPDAPATYTVGSTVFYYVGDGGYGITNVNGTFVFSNPWLTSTYNMTYLLLETRAPTGYVFTPNTYTMFSYKPHDPINGIDVLQIGGLLNLTNNKIPNVSAVIEGRKSILEASDTDKVFTFHAVQVSAPNDSGTTIGSTMTDTTVGAGNFGFTLSGLTNGTYYYRVWEDQPADLDVQYDSTGNHYVEVDIASNGAVTVKYLTAGDTDAVDATNSAVQFTNKVLPNPTLVKESAVTSAADATQTPVPDVGNSDLAHATEVKAGDIITYTMTFDPHSTGTNKITIWDPLPTDPNKPGVALVELVPGSIKYTTVDGVEHDVPDSALTGGTIHWPEVTQVGGGQSTYTFQVKVLPSDDLVNIVNSASGSLVNDFFSSKSISSNPVWHKKLPSPPLSLSFVKVDSVSEAAITTQNAALKATFELYNYDISTSTKGTLVDTQTSDANSQVSFAGLKSGTYLLVEKQAPAGYWTPTGSWLVTVNTDPTLTLPADQIKIVSQGTGTLDFQVKTVGPGEDILQLPNVKLPTADAVINGHKTVAGNDGKLLTTPYTFYLTQVTAPDGSDIAATPAYTDTVTRTGPGDFSFTLKDLIPGTYYYKINEVPGGISGITYDSSAHYVKVEVSGTAGVAPVVTYLTTSTYIDLSSDAAASAVQFLNNSAVTPTLKKSSAVNGVANLDGNGNPNNTTIPTAAEVKAGDVITYTISSSVPNANGTIWSWIFDPIPDGLEFVPGSITYTTADGVTHSVADDAVYDPITDYGWTQVDAQLHTQAYSYDSSLNKYVVAWPPMKQVGDEITTYSFKVKVLPNNLNLTTYSNQADGYYWAGNPGGKTPEEVTNWVRHKKLTDTLDFDFTKIDANSNPLPGATFMLYSFDNTAGLESDPAVVAPGTTGSAWVTPVTQTSAAANAATPGLVSFTGLKSGNYLLVESQAPKDYKTPAGSWLVTVDTSGATPADQIKIVSQGTDMPDFKVTAGASGGDVLQLPNVPIPYGGTAIHGQKTVAGTPDTNPTFTFTLTQVEGSEDGSPAVTPAYTDTKTTTGPGSFDFALQNLMPGATYYYRISEAQDNSDTVKWAYDQSNQLVIISVTDDGTTIVTYPDGTQETKTPDGTVTVSNPSGKAYVEFTNTYHDSTTFTFYKVDESGHALPGAVFQLYSYDSTVAHTSNVPGEPDSCWVLYDTQTSGPDGLVSFAGVRGDPQGYMLVETQTKAGYSLPLGYWNVKYDMTTDPANPKIVITVASGMPMAFRPGTRTIDGANVAVLELPNYPNPNLPMAGGAGTILFTVGGIVLIGGAIVLWLLLGKKKKKK